MILAVMWNYKILLKAVSVWETALFACFNLLSVNNCAGLKPCNDL